MIFSLSSFLEVTLIRTKHLSLEHAYYDDLLTLLGSLRHLTSCRVLNLSIDSESPAELVPGSLSRAADDAHTKAFLANLIELEINVKFSLEWNEQDLKFLQTLETLKVSCALGKKRRRKQEEE